MAEYTFETETTNGSLMITGLNVEDGVTEVVIPSTIDGKPVTEIGDHAFYRCTGLTSVVIPNSVIEIGDHAFAGCTGLTSVVIPSSVTKIRHDAFRGCTGLTSVVIPDNVTEIGDRAFAGCAGLTSVVILDSVAEIESSAFWGCNRLTSFVVDDENPNYIAINGLLCSKDGKTLIACPGGLTSVEIPDSVTEIGRWAFHGCDGLTSVVIPEGVTEIGPYAFSDCTGLTSVVIPDSVTKIGDEAFCGCCSLTSVEIPDSVTDITYAAFEGCTGLISVVIPDSVTEIDSSAFEGCTGLTSVVIPSSVTKIGDEAFCGCSSLTAVKIPEGVTEIGDYTFSLWTSGYSKYYYLQPNDLKAFLLSAYKSSVYGELDWWNILEYALLSSSVVLIHDGELRCHKVEESAWDDECEPLFAVDIEDVISGWNEQVDVSIEDVPSRTGCFVFQISSKKTSWSCEAQSWRGVPDERKLKICLMEDWMEIVGALIVSDEGKLKEGFTYDGEELELVEEWSHDVYFDDLFLIGEGGAEQESVRAELEDLFESWKEAELSKEEVEVQIDQWLENLQMSLLN